MGRLTLCLVGVLTLSLIALAEEAADTFNLLYGNDLKRVAATKDAADDLALAQQLLEAAKTPKTEAPLIALLCEKAYELAHKDPKGVPVAIQAMELAAEKVAGKKGEYLEKIVAIRQQQYTAARGDAKAKVGEDLLVALDRTAEAKADAGDLDGAAALYRRALTVLATPEVKDRIKTNLAELTVRQKMHKQVADLKAKVEANPNDTASRIALIRLYLVEFDNPAEAAKYLGEGVDEATQKYLPAATKPVTEAPELACLELGDWYMTLSDNASDAARQKMLSRAAAYYSRFLELHAADDMDKTKAALGLKKAEAAQAKLSASSSGHGDTAGWVDVLRLVDPKKDLMHSTQAGTCEAVSNGLHFLAKDGDRVQIPVSPQGPYELRVKFTVNVVADWTYIYLPVAQAGSFLEVSATEGCIGYLPGESRAAVVRPGAPPRKEPYLVECKVVPIGDEATIDVKLDGKPYLHWRGGWSSLSHGTFRIDPKALGVGARNGDVTFHSVQLRMISGNAMSLRPPTPETPTKARPTKN